MDTVHNTFFFFFRSCGRKFTQKGQLNSHCRKHHQHHPPAVAAAAVVERQGGEGKVEDEEVNRIIDHHDEDQRRDGFKEKEKKQKFDGLNEATERPQLKVVRS